jgi:hypothetical protein
VSASPHRAARDRHGVTGRGGVAALRSGPSRVLQPMTKFRTILLTAVTALTVAAPAAQAGGDVDLRHQPSFEIVGAGPIDTAGSQVAPAGDVNGDGIDDVIVAAPSADVHGRRNAGAVYVVFGRRRTRAAVRAHPAARIAMDGAQAQGFAILGGHAHDEAGLAVAPAGDVNGDGLDDVVLSTDEGAAVPLGPPGYRASAGTVYLIYGSRRPRAVDLAQLGAQGVRIDNDAPRTFQFGLSVAGGRDVNGDGSPDVVASDEAEFNLNGQFRTPADIPPPFPSHAYVLFGGRGGALAQAGTTLHTAQLGTAGYAISGLIARVSLAADMNGDGRAEVVLTTGTQRPDGGTQVGVVAYGRPATAQPLDVRQLTPADGFAVLDSRRLPQASQLSGGDDTNGDGRGDVVATSYVLLGHERYAGTAAVVFGAPSGDAVYVNRPSPRLLTAVSPAVPFIDPPPRPKDIPAELWLTSRMLGPNPVSVASIVGDLDGDGRADVLTGGGWSPKGRRGAGSAFVFKGRAAAGRIALTGPHRGSTVRIDGAYADDDLGVAATSAGDFDGDGRPDLLISGPSATRDGRLHAGAAWVITGVQP